MELTTAQQIQALSSQLAELTGQVNGLKDALRALGDKVQAQAFTPKPNPRMVSVPRQEATPRQIRYLHAVCRELGIDAESLESHVRECVGCAVEELSRRDISELIEHIQRNQGLPVNG